jgi:hypothetical protein
VFRHGAATLATTGLTRVYVHDDRLGPYARMLWQVQHRPLVEGEEEDPRSSHPSLTLSHEPYPEGGQQPRGAPMTVYSAVVPLYPKLRLTARGLLYVAGEFFPLVKLLVRPEDRDKLRIDLRFMLSGDYLAEILSAGLDDQRRIADFVRQASLPRYVGVVRFCDDNGAIMDAVCDTTDIFRDVPKYGSVLTLFAFTTENQHQADQYLQHIQRRE